MAGTVSGELEGVGQDIKECKKKIEELEQKLLQPDQSERAIFLRRLAAQEETLAALQEKEVLLMKQAQGSAAVAGDLADDTAGFLRGILPMGTLPDVDELHNLFTEGLCKDGRRVLLPVTNFTYNRLVSDTLEWRNWVQPVSECNAHYLAEHISSILNKRTSQPGAELVMPAILDSMVYDIMQLLAHHLRSVPMKRHRNQTEVSLTSPSLRPDFWLLVEGTMLFKGEEKTKDHELAAARQDLLSKMKDWDPAYHGEVPYLLCYAAAGLTFQFHAIPREQPGTLLDLTHTFNINDGFHRLLIVHATMRSYCIIMAQAGRLPRDHRMIGYTDVRPYGTTITILDSSVVKEVDYTQHPLLNIIKGRMGDVYKAAEDCPNLIHAMPTYPRLRGGKYCVALVPVGRKLAVGSFPVKLLRVAVRCVLTALSALHKAGYGHGDLRWENVIWVTDACFVVIDLEGTMSLASQEEQQQVLRCEAFPRAWGANKEALVDGRFTAASDLYMLGCMVQQIQQVQPAALSGLGDGLVQALLSKQFSLEQAQAHAWLQE